MSAIDRDAVMRAAGPEIEAVKDEAQALVARMRRPPLVGIALTIGFGVLLAPIGLFPLGVFLGILVMSGWVVLRFLRSARSLFDARRAVHKAIAPALDMTFHPAPTRNIDLAAFRGTYWGQVLGQSKLEDALEGTRGGVRVTLADAKIYGRSKGPDGEWRANEPPKWLKGVVFSMVRIIAVEAPGRWTARTVVVRDQGLVNSFYTPKELEKVALVDRQFEKVFEVVSSDQTEARAVLTPDVMERLMTLEDLFTGVDTPPVAVFENGVFLVAMSVASTPTASTEPETRDELADVTVERVLDEIEAVMSVVDALTGKPSHAAI